MRVMVYGSLKRGYHNHVLLENSEYLGEYLSDPIFTMVSLGAFPGIVEGGSTSIEGELYEVSKETEQQLDLLEGIPYMYSKHYLEDDLITYTYNIDYNNSYNIISSGIW